MGSSSVAEMTNAIDYTTKAGKLKASILKNYKDLNIDRVDGEAGNSGQTPPNGNAWGYGKEHPDNGNNGNGGNGNDGNNGGGNDPDDGNTTTGVDKPDKFIYYYHPDHLGSSSYISNALGEVVQHIEYFAFGETFLEEHSNTDRTPYLFNGKELDEETGLYYYGARYYDPVTSVWQSVDPLAEKYPSISPYTYVANNPIMFIDPDGNKILPISKKWGWGIFSWTTYPNFYGGYSGTHGETFGKVRDKMLKSSSVFKSVYSQLENSSKVYEFKEQNITQGGVMGAMNTDIDANGYFTPNSSGGVITLNWDMLNDINGYKSKSTIFEEVFHAGQSEYYSGIQPSRIDKEVEAKVAKAIEGFGSFTYGGFNEFVENLKAGTLTSEQINTFNDMVKDYAKGISKDYIKYYKQKGMSDKEANKLFGMDNFTGFMPYLETLLKTDLQTNTIEIKANK